MIPTTVSSFHAAREVWAELFCEMGAKAALKCRKKRQNVSRYINNIYHRAKRNDPCFFHALVLKNRHHEHFRNEKAVFKLREIRSPANHFQSFSILSSESQPTKVCYNKETYAEPKRAVIRASFMVNGLKCCG
jgi:hypothetical protein